MRCAILLAFVLISAGMLPAQSTPAPASQPRPCTAQPAPPITPADRVLAMEDFATAEGLYATDSQTKPSVAAYTGLVHAELGQGKLTEALATAQRASGAFPASGDAAALVGDALLRSGQIPQASEAYRKAIALDPCSAAAHFGFGELAGLAARHTVERQQKSIAHHLAPANPLYTAALFPLIPADRRQAPLKAFLESNPLLPRSAAQQLARELHLLESGALCTPSKPYTSAQLALQPLLFQAKFPRSWGLKVKIDKAELPLLELDSSVSGVVLNPKDAQKAGVHPLPGEATNAAYTGIAEHLKIDSLEFLNCPVQVDPALDVSSSNSLIGIDFFQDHLIHIDYVAEMLTLSPLPPIPGAVAAKGEDGFVAADEKDWSPVYFAHGQVLVPTLVNRKGPYLFALDTGISNTITSPALTAAVLGATGDSTVNLRGVSGPIVKVLPREGGVNVDQTDVLGPDGKLLRVTRPVKLPVFRFTHNETGGTEVVSFSLTPLSETDKVEVSGLFGFDLLDQFSIDVNYRDGLARILFDQNRRYAVRQAEKAY